MACALTTTTSSSAPVPPDACSPIACLATATTGYCCWKPGHLCYGDPGHKHIVEPENARILTALANGIAGVTGRRLDWIHIPVPKERHDAAFFQPLKRLRLPPETRLYLGLVHMTDAQEGARRRIAAAREAVREFGIATECGFGRRPPETVVPLLELHERVAHGADA